MKPFRILSRSLVLVALVPVLAWSQALTSITSLYVAYNTRKVTARPTGELKARLDSLDVDLRAASRVGRSGEVRRLLAKGNALLAGREWTDVADFAASLLLRTDRVVVESGKPYAMRLEQLYSPSIELPRSLTAQASLRTRPTGIGAAMQPGQVVKELGKFGGVSRDLRESPLQMEFDLRDVADGRYVVAVDVRDDARTLGTASLAVVLRKGVDATVSRLESEATRAPEALRAEILFPVDRMRNVNRGRLELRMLDIDRDFAAADSVLVAVKAGKDPYAGRTGDIKRHYALASADEVISYRMYVPSAYAQSRPAPLIIALHGLGGTEDSFFDGYGRKLPELAEQRGYIIAAPLGYRVDGAYGYGVGAPPADAATRRTQELSEEDVMQVLAQVRKLYKIDENRIYLMGHSMGAIGTWKLAPKYPDIWAALGLFAGQGTPSTVEQMRHIPAFVVHGDADPTVNVAGSRAMVAAMKTLGVELMYTEVPGGNHSDVVEPNLPAMFDFFDAHKRGVKQAKDYQVGRIRTDLGEILFVLANETPRHKESFMKLAASHYWDSLTFNRVVKNFVVQGGCPDTPQGFAGSPYLLAPEFNDGLKHVYGAVAAGRDNNPGQVSAGCQFYIVANKTGLARLDNHYTVFGQVVKGMDVVEAIVSVPRDSTDTPRTPIKLHIDVITMTAEQLKGYGFGAK